MTAITGLNTGQIRVAGTGKVLVATVGTAGPTDTSTPWAAGWQDLGYTTDEGVVLSKKDSWDGIDVWQSIFPARYVPKSRELSAKFVLVQWNGVSIPLWGGGGATAPNGATAGEYTYDISSSLVAFERALGIEFTDNVGSVTTRLIIARSMVTDTTDVNLTRSKNASLGLTFGAMQDSVGSPVVHFISRDANWAP